MSLRSRVNQLETEIATLKTMLIELRLDDDRLQTSVKALQADIEQSRKKAIESQLKHHNFSTGKVVTLSRHYAYIGNVSHDVVLLRELAHGWYVVETGSPESTPFFAYNSELFEKKEGAK